VQLNSESYREPRDVPSGSVLVVGDGASGRDIAAELCLTNNVLLATGKKRRLLPERILGVSAWWWLRVFGLLRAPSDSLVGKVMRRADAFPNRSRADSDLRRLGISIVPRLVEAQERVARFADGTQAEIDAIVWNVGYRDDAAWLDIAAAKDNAGRLLQEEGVSPVPGFFHVGRPWQRNRASALVMGAGDDAAWVVSYIRNNFSRARPSGG